jgi:hypothetical protein
MAARKRKLTEKEKADRAAKRASRVKAAKMRTPRELSAVLGCGLNQVYSGLDRGDFPGCIRLGARWLIPDRVIERLLNGEPLKTA